MYVSQTCVSESQLKNNLCWNKYCCLIITNKLIINSLINSIILHCLCFPKGNKRLELGHISNVKYRVFQLRFKLTF